MIREGAASTSLPLDLSAKAIGLAMLGSIGIGGSAGAVGAVFYVLAKNIQIKGLIDELEDSDFFDSTFGVPSGL